MIDDCFFSFLLSLSLFPILVLSFRPTFSGLLATTFLREGMFPQKRKEGGRKSWCSPPFFLLATFSFFFLTTISRSEKNERKIKGRSCFEQFRFHFLPRNNLVRNKRFVFSTRKKRHHARSAPLSPRRLQQHSLYRLCCCGCKQSWARGGCSSSSSSDGGSIVDRRSRLSLLAPRALCRSQQKQWQ